MFLPKAIDSQQHSFPISSDSGISSQQDGRLIGLSLNHSSFTRTQCKFIIFGTKRASLGFSGRTDTNCQRLLSSTLTYFNRVLSTEGEKFVDGRERPTRSNFPFTFTFDFCFVAQHFFKFSHLQFCKIEFQAFFFLFLNNS